MIVENVERIVFRFSNAEIAALLELMGIQRLPGTSIAASYPDKVIIEKLVADGIVMPCGEHTFVDKAVSVIIMTVAASERYIEAVCNEKHIVLYKSDTMCVLLEERQNIVRVEPIRNLETAHEPWKMALANLGSNPQVHIMDNGVQCVTENMDLFFV